MDTTVDIVAPVAERQEGPALRHLPSHLLFWPVAVFFLWLDLWSKHVVFRLIAPEEKRIAVKDFLEFRRSLNDGAVFGSFTGYVSVFIVASIVALGFVFYLFAHSTRRQHGLHIALGLILSGALGNLYDRAFVKADVVSYVNAEGEPQTVIGKIISEPDDRYIRVGSWPDGVQQKIVRRESAQVHQQGVVRDFLRFIMRFPSWVPVVGGYDIWPWIFNVADAALVCGVGFLLLHCWYDRRPNETPVV